MAKVFNGYELLLLNRLQSQPEVWLEWKEKLAKDTRTDHISAIPQSLWFLSVALVKRPEYLQKLIHDEAERERSGTLRGAGDTLLSAYLSSHQFTEFHLDSIFKYGEENKLPKEIFKCANVRFLSLKYNCLYEIPPDIGQMKKLNYLALTNNRLHVQSIPYTLVFCSSLTTILLDNNLLDALPGFLLQMPSIERVHRHGNHNYFKSTFMWYHTDVHYRIIPFCGNSDSSLQDGKSLAFWAAKSLIGIKTDFFQDPSVAPVLKEYICDIYDQFNVCHYCSRACLVSQQGFKVITFKNPYLGNTCVPFQHWACSIECAKELEVPARLEQIEKARELDCKYEKYITDCQESFQRRKCGGGLWPRAGVVISEEEELENILAMQRRDRSRRCTIL